MKISLDHKLEVRSDTFWVETHTWYILQIMKEWNWRNMSGLMSYEYFFGGWLNIWCAQWFVSIRRSLTRGKESRNCYEMYLMYYKNWELSLILCCPKWLIRWCDCVSHQVMLVSRIWRGWWNICWVGMYAGIHKGDTSTTLQKVCRV